MKIGWLFSGFKFSDSENEMIAHSSPVRPEITEITQLVTLQARRMIANPCSSLQRPGLHFLRQSSI